MIDSKLQIPLLVKHKDGNIGNYEYIGTSILQIYWIYQRYIGIYFDTKYQ